MIKYLVKNDDGFSLVELLVTIAVLAALFGIVTMTLSGVGSNAQSEICNAEVGVVQSAIDIYLAENPGIELTPGTDTTISNEDGEFAEYLRGTTEGLYSWTSAGVLTAGTCPAPDPPVGCGIPAP